MPAARCVRSRDGAFPEPIVPGDDEGRPPVAAPFAPPPAELACVTRSWCAESRSRILYALSSAPTSTGCTRGLCNWFTCHATAVSNGRCFRNVEAAVVATFISVAGGRLRCGTGTCGVPRRVDASGITEARAVPGRTPCTSIIENYATNSVPG